MDQHGYMQGRYQAPVTPGPDFQQHEALFYDQGFTDGQQAHQDELVANTKKRLHWFQWVTYTFVIMTCLVVMYSLFETWQMILSIQEAFAKLSESWGNLDGN